MLKPVSGEMEELQEILTRLSAVTPGCEVRRGLNHALIFAGIIVTIYTTQQKFSKDFIITSSFVRIRNNLFEVINKYGDP